MFRNFVLILCFFVSLQVSGEEVISFESYSLQTLAAGNYQQVVSVNNRTFIISEDNVSEIPINPENSQIDNKSAMVVWIQSLVNQHQNSDFFPYFVAINGELVAAVVQGRELRLVKFNASSSETEQIAKPLQLTSPVEQWSITRQHDGEGEKLLVFMFSNNKLIDVWKWDEQSTGWSIVKHSISANIVTSPLVSTIPLNQSFVLGLAQSGAFYLFNTITNEWVENETSPLTGNIVASLIDVKQLNQFEMLVLDADTGALEGFSASLERRELQFGYVNMAVLVVYLTLVLLIGLMFSFKNKNTDDYFLGGKSIPWWAAACSIYATMLSSLTYVALPAIVYQTNWILLVGIWMLIVVAPVGIYIAMPFFRSLNIYSAYEYLSLRFNYFVRVMASVLFALFHIGRMGIVMALTALALSAVTPLSPLECVLIMGVLCLIYCTFGGIEAVIWTDTVQTVVLLLGAVLCFVIIITNLEGGMTTFIDVGLANDKFTLANTDFSLSGITELTLWVIVIGGIGQNMSSYIADQAVVQRYLVTPDDKSAARSIWANAFIGLPGALLFFLNGTGLYVYYKTQPEKLDPTIQIDQIFPSFISTELPIGIAGVIIAGVFAAAQSTVSTSMNSVATTLIVDVIKPAKLIKNAADEINWARAITFVVGAIGTGVGLIFIDPGIRSLMEEYFKIIGMFMGALGGLFILGGISTRANTLGAIVGLFCGVAVMLSAWKFGWANGYIYASLGIVTCVVVGYLASFLSPNTASHTGLTLFSAKNLNKG